MCIRDRVSVNTGAILNPAIIEQGAKRYGSQCVVLSMDVKRVDGRFHLFAKGGREDTGIDALEWAKMGENSGAGELVVNSIDTDGVRDGFDLEMLQAVADRVSTVSYTHLDVYKRQRQYWACLTSSSTSSKPAPRCGKIISGSLLTLFPSAHGLLQIKRVSASKTT